MSRLTTDAAFNQRWDNGAGLAASRNDAVLADSEIRRGGGEAAFATDFRRLSLADQRSVTLGLKSPAVQAVLERGLDPRLSAADAAASAAGRRFAIEALGVQDVSVPLTAESLAGLPAHVVPATPQEARIARLRAALTDGRSMSLVELGRFLAQHALAPPTVQASDLARAIAEDPRRFAGAEVRVIGDAEKISERRSMGLTYGLRYDLFAGEMRWGWKTTAIMETRHRMFTRGEPQHAIELYDRDVQSSFVTVGRLNLGSANAAQLGDDTYAVTGRVDVSGATPRIVMRNIEVR